ncbi:Hypothetical predicted protein [Olea europaea subsp. europaea]|uniref:Uncharacterized protein n=1 Tax=Olea europaea subsp. europaea TaxID=158383 RepID=A0A8S0PWT4_OLEEU|nr:Hypothetical predicted protein [Olea europaea subsp. europaea]
MNIELVNSPIQVRFYIFPFSHYVYPIHRILENNSLVASFRFRVADEGGFSFISMVELDSLSDKKRCLYPTLIKLSKETMRSDGQAVVSGDIIWMESWTSTEDAI